MTERLFFALWPGDGQRAALSRIQSRILRGHPAHQGRPTHPDDLHLTLVFLGDLDARGRSCVEEAACRAADQVEGTGFRIQLDHLGCFPRARVLWCSASDHPQPLLDLVDALESGSRTCGQRPERRPFMPHVTLARNARPLPARVLEQGLERTVEWPVTEFALVIALPDERPRYRVLRTWPLTL